jgi:steroid delta-isomerase-like uncharacterized protein
MDQQRIDDAETGRATGMRRRTMLMGIGGGAGAALLATLGPAARRGAAQEATPVGADGLFLVIRRYRLDSGVTIAEVVRRTQEGFVPIIQQVPGFVEYYNVDLGNGEGATIGIFASQASAEDSTERATAWAREHIAGLVQGPPEVMEGPVLLHVTAEGARELAATEAIVRTTGEVVRLLMAALNAGDLATLDELVAPGFVDRMPLPGVPPGRDGLKQVIAQFRAAFPDAHWTVEDLIAEGDKVAVRVTFRGTHRGELFGVPPTGRQVTVPGIGIYRVVDGQIAEEWVVRDLLGLLQQLGALPVAGSSGT